MLSTTHPRKQGPSNGFGRKNLTIQLIGHPPVILADSMVVNVEDNAPVSTLQIIMPRKSRRNKKHNNSQSRASNPTSNFHCVTQADGQMLVKDDLKAKRRSTRVPLSVPRNITGTVHWFRLGVDKGGINTSTTVSVTDCITFALTDIDASLLAGFTAVFDEYCIPFVEVQIIPSNFTVLTNTGMFTTVIDQDDGNSPGTYNELLDYNSTKTTHGQIGHTRHVYPTLLEGVNVNAAGSASFTGRATTRSWIDCASDTVDHYGVKLGSTATSAIISYQYRCVYYLAFRSLH